MKVSLALGGWNDSAGDKYSRLVNNPAARKKFIAQAVQFLEKYNFDGLDLDWEYPVCWQVCADDVNSLVNSSFLELIIRINICTLVVGRLQEGAVLGQTRFRGSVERAQQRVKA